MNPFPVPYRDDPRAPAAYRPWRAQYQLLADMDQLLGLWPLSGAAADHLCAPADLSETDEAYIVELDLPGVQKGDLSIEATGRRLSVHGERRDGQNRGLLRRRGRVTGEFQYAWSLPGDVDAERIQARLESGVLTIEVPKAEHTRPRKIAIS